MHPFSFFWGGHDGHFGGNWHDGSQCGPGGRGFGGHCGPGGGGRHHGPPFDGDGDGGGDGGGSSLGVRRPLRFLAYKLELEENQVAELARILNDLKTERAQAEVDQRRTLTAFADSFAGDSFDLQKATEGAKLRVSSAERLRDAVLTALTQIHAILTAEQRSKFAYLIRTGTLTL